MIEIVIITTKNDNDNYRTRDTLSSVWSTVTVRWSVLRIGGHGKCSFYKLLLGIVPSFPLLFSSSPVLLEPFVRTVPSLNV